MTRGKSGPIAVLASWCILGLVACAACGVYAFSRVLR